MEIDPQYFEERKAKAEQLYASHRTVYNPYLDCEVALNSDGFHHLQFSARRLIPNLRKKLGKIRQIYSHNLRQNQRTKQGKAA